MVTVTLATSEEKIQLIVFTGLLFNNGPLIKLVPQFNWSPIQLVPKFWTPFLIF